MADNAQALQQIQQAGVPTEYIDQFRGNKKGILGGSNLDPQDVSRVIQSYGTQQMGKIQGQIAQLGSQQYQFDPNQFLPGIQQQAESIYAPQQAQLEAIRQLQQGQYQETKVQTEKDFEKRMQQEVEAINRRGGFFSGGAIQNEQDIRSQQASALQQLNLQSNAAQFSNYAQQASLRAEQTQFVNDRLNNAESGAYARWQDQRNFSMQALQTQYQVFSQERDYVRNVFESDRAYAQNQEQAKMQKEQFKQKYKIDELTYKKAKNDFDYDIKIKGLSYDTALAKFKKTYPNNNYGPIGTDENGDDLLELYRNSFYGNKGTQPSLPPSSTNDYFNF
jgi:hypothetical protein